MRGSGSSGPFSIGASTGARLRPFPENLAGKDLQSALARLRHADPFLDPVLGDHHRRAVEQADRIRSGLLDAADRFGRVGTGMDSSEGYVPEEHFDLEQGLAEFARVLAERDDLDDAGRDMEVASLRDEMAERTLLAGFDAAGERAGLPGMEAFVAGVDETLIGSPVPDKGSGRTPVQARIRGRLDDRRRREKTARTQEQATARKALADRVSNLRSFLVGGNEAPSDAREVLDSARAEGVHDDATFDQLDRLLAGRLSFESARDEAIARIDDAIAGVGPDAFEGHFGPAILAGDRPWLDCHFEHWLLDRNGSNKDLLKNLPYMPIPEDMSDRCLHRLIGWPVFQDIVTYSRSVGTTPPMVANRITAQWESGSDRDKVLALEFADAIRNETGEMPVAPGLRKALSLVAGGSSPEQVVAYRKANPQSFQEANPTEGQGRSVDTKQAPGTAGGQDLSAAAQAVEGVPEEGVKNPKIHELVRRQAEADLAPETLPREDLAKRKDEGWNAWGVRIYNALVEAPETDPDAVRKIARRYYGELNRPENADVLIAANQKVSLDAYLNPPSDQLIDGAELEAFKTWQKENPGAEPSEYGLNKSFTAYLAADGNFYRHSADTSKRTGTHAALLSSELKKFEHYASVALGEYEHVWDAALSSGPSFGRGNSSFSRYGQRHSAKSSAQSQPSSQKTKNNGAVGRVEEPDEWAAYNELIKTEEAQKTPGIGFSLIKKGQYKKNDQLIQEWEVLHGKRWPMDPETGQRQHVHHIIPLADGGTDHVSNIKPLTKRAHIKLHKENGDSSRWGSRLKYIEDIIRKGILPFDPYVSTE